MKFVEFMILFVHFLDIFREVTVKCKVPDELIPELYLNYVAAVTSDEPQSSLRRVFHRNKEYVFHVRKLKEVNGLKNHNFQVKVIGRGGGEPSELFYINNPVESKIPKAFLTLEEFKEALANRVNYKHTTEKVLITRNKDLETTNMKPNITTTIIPNVAVIHNLPTTIKTLKIVRNKYVKLIKGLPVNNSPISSSEFSKETVNSNPDKKTKLPKSLSKLSNLTRIKTKLRKNKVTTGHITREHTLTIRKTEDLSNVAKATEIKSSVKVAKSDKVEGTTTVSPSESETTVTNNEPDQIEATAEFEKPPEATEATTKFIEPTEETEEPTEETEPESSPTSAPKRHTLSRPLVFEFDDDKKNE